MIVVIGHPILRAAALGGGAGGTVARIAVTAAVAGRAVQLVGKVGDDPEGDALLLALAEAGVGHVALLRDPARRTPVVVAESAGADEGAPTGDAADLADDDALDEPAPPTIEPPDPAARPTLEPADVELALRYLSDYRVIVVAEPGRADLVEVAAAAAGYGEAALIVLVAPGSDGPAGATVIEAPASDPDGTFGTLVGTLAADFDADTLPDGGIGGAASRLGWTRADDADETDGRLDDSDDPDDPDGAEG
jgi:hypothetical protein